MGVEMPAEAKQMIDAARDSDLPAPIKDLQRWLHSALEERFHGHAHTQTPRPAA